MRFHPGVESDDRFASIGLVLPDGDYLLVGRDAGALHEALDLVGEGTVWILCAVLPLALLSGLVVSALTLRRLEAINRLTVEIRGGNMNRRLPQSAHDDEFGRLAGHLNAMLDSIENLTDGIRQVSNEIAHEMRTPLTRIHNKLEVIRRDPTIAGNMAETIDAVSGELKGLLSTFTAMLKIAELDAGTLVETFKKFDLSSLLSNLVKDFAPIAEDNAIALRAQIEPHLHSVGDRRLIAQMLVNMLENAISHSHANELVLSARRQGSIGAIVIADNGIGILQDERKRVFQRFYRLQNGSKSTGVGLGLSLVAAIARLHRMSISLHDNEPGLRVELTFSFVE
jgi:signal transduction histidine kinase